HAVAGGLGVEAGTAFLGVLVFLENDYARPFAHDEAIAVLVPRPRGVRRVVVARRQGAGGTKTPDTQLAQRRLRSAGDHHVGHLVLDEAGGVADGVGARGARSGDRGVRSLDLEKNGD